MKTKVEFLYNEREDDLFAFFPEKDYYDNPLIKTSYAHIGQHSACHIEYAKESREATKKEYEPLKRELESLGYDLIIMNRV